MARSFKHSRAQSCTALGLMLSTQRSPQLNVLRVLATAPTLPDFWLSLQDKIKVREVGARLKLPFSPPCMKVPQLHAGSIADTFCKAAHHALMHGSKTHAQAAPHIPKQPQGLSNPPINPRDKPPPNVLASSSFPCVSCLPLSCRLH